MNVIWLDECAFSVGEVSGTVWVTLCPGEEYEEDCLVPCFPVLPLVWFGGLFIETKRVGWSFGILHIGVVLLAQPTSIILSAQPCILGGNFFTQPDAPILAIFIFNKTMLLLIGPVLLTMQCQSLASQTTFSLGQLAPQI